MSKQGLFGKTLNLAHHAVAIKNIIKALMQGGWAAAALQAIKYYWPQILCAFLILILLPTIIICTLPMTMFGFEGSTDSKITEMAAQAEIVEEYFARYEQYCEQRTNQINTETEAYINSDYQILQVGYYMPKNWFIAVFSVSVGNDLSSVTEQQIIDFISSCIICEIDDENKTVTVKRLSANEVMDYLNYSDSDKSWATLIFKTLESEGENGYYGTYT